MASNRPQKRSHPTRETKAKKSHVTAILALALIMVGSVAVGAYAWWRHRISQDSEISEEHTPEPQTYSDRVERIVDDMTLEQKVGQLFITTPESITGVGLAVAAGDATRDALLEYPVGGLVYFADNLQDRSQTTEMLHNVTNYAKDACGVLPFLCVDEEGGSVARVASNPAFGVRDVGSALDIGSSGDPELARAAAEEVGTYLTDLGFNVDFAPVADIVESEESALYGRSFGSDAQAVSSMVEAEVEGYAQAGILCAVKHFPGIGSAEGDSHNSRIYSYRTLDEMREFELVPFKGAIDAGVPMVMVGHLSCLELNRGEGDAPASMSHAILTDLLRDDLGYTGLIVTDSLAMGAVDDFCTPSEQGVKAVEAGADIVLIPSDFKQAYRELLRAVRDGEISESRIDESVRRIIDAKIRLGA